jgi:exodeoxyribonuclease V beta subunit
METHEYPLQALIYLVATHRFLRWRLPDYEPDRHLAGAAYLFVRGMGSDRPAGHAVFWWRPATAAIEALDRLLARGAA